VYQQLYEMDLRKDYTKLDVPVYFLLGRYDVNAPKALVEEYVQILERLKRRSSGLSIRDTVLWINERDRFVKEVLACFQKD